jgi:hypothetical protein
MAFMQELPGKTVQLGALSQVWFSLPPVTTTMTNSLWTQKPWLLIMQEQHHSSRMGPGLDVSLRRFAASFHRVNVPDFSHPEDSAKCQSATNAPPSATDQIAM